MGDVPDNIEDLIRERVDERVSEALDHARVVVPMWLNTSKASEYLGISKKQLEAWRYEGLGPEYVKRGRLVLYPRVGLDLWLREGTA
ncbi:hypothetical protein ATO10_09773 [Actibacterium atlanticum]|uniref:Helix-turn-helix domain-containing protein n=1 Tax=Actibacterium atlanticum TaxID=1461693 RepID=A0A058ZKH4_9RHOB|nr:helix-turn-helix domain-containing protein [Actibacterium atlanticum]KCV82124.1 hypothetical protein ATO10_09773 [Actibacterium atlanticum]